MWAQDPEDAESLYNTHCHTQHETGCEGRRGRQGPNSSTRCITRHVINPLIKRNWSMCCGLGPLGAEGAPCPRGADNGGGDWGGGEDREVNRPLLQSEAGQEGREEKLEGETEASS